MTLVDLPVAAGTSVDGLIEAMNDPDWRVRRNAVADLAVLGDRYAVEVVLQSLRDGHGSLSVASSAIHVLATAGVDTFTVLVEFLHDPHAELRCCAALTLGLQNELRGVPVLLNALNDEDTNVRYHAIEALGRLRSAEATEALLALAETRDFTLGFAALEALANIDDGRVARSLASLLDDDLLQAAVLDVLGQLGDEEEVVPLANLVNLPGSPVEAIARNLVRLHDRLNSGAQASIVPRLLCGAVKPTGRKNLLDALEQTDKTVAGPILTVLSWLTDAMVDPILAQYLDHAEVADFFARQGKSGMDAVVRQLRSSKLEIQQAAVMILGRIGSPSATPILVSMLKENVELIVMIAGALALIGDRSAYVPLVELLSWEDPAVRRAAISALNSLGHEDMARDMATRLRDPEPRVREGAARIVGYMGYPELIDVLVERCRDEEESVRKAAVESLPSMEEDDRIVAALALALCDASGRVRGAAAKTLGQLSASASGPLLRQALGDPNVWVRYYAARSLARSPSPAALEDLLRLSRTDEAMQVRVAVAEALGRHGGEAAARVLVELADSFDVDLARAALAALGVLGSADAIAILCKAVSSAEPGRRLEAIRALGETHAAEAVIPLAQAAESKVREVAVAAIQGLQRLAVPAAVDALIALAAAPTVRDACVAALTICDAAQVAEGLKHPLLDVRLVVVRALDRSRDPRVASYLLTACADKEGAVRFAVVRALAHREFLPSTDKWAALMESDPDRAVRRAAQALLRR